NGKDFYMIFASDPQYPWTDDDIKRTAEQENAESERLNRDHIKSMQTIAAQVGRENLKGVIINGDLTAFGHGYQLAKYKEMYDQGLGLKIYPGLGNHDYANNVNRCHENNCATRMVTYMNDFVKDLNPISYDFYVSDQYYKFPSLRKDYQGSLAYSWEIGDVHFVQLHNYPAYTNSWNGWNGDAARRDYVEITSSMNWLRKDLTDARNRGKIIILNMHDAANTDYPNPDKNSGDQNHFAEEHPAEFAEYLKMLDELKVSAVFAGHLHGTNGEVSIGYSGKGPLFLS